MRCPILQKDFVSDSRPRLVRANRRPWPRLVACVSLLVGNCWAVAAAIGGEPKLADWQQPYVGENATGEQVIAYWSFVPGEESRDQSGHGHELRLRGRASFASQGRFGACLESFAADGDNAPAEGAIAKNAADLSPSGAFTLELWLQPKPEMEARETAFLLDKKYYHYAKDIPQANWDYCLYLAKAGRQRRQLVAYLGYGRDSAAYTSRSFPMLPGQWYHLAFSYDGAGTGRFFVDGRPMGRTVHAGRGAIAPGQYDLVVGDRYGSLFVGCPAYLDEVRLTKGLVPDFASALELDLSAQRLAFVRGEPQPHVAVRVGNATNQPLSNLQLDVEFGNDTRTLPAPDLAAGAEQVVEFPIDSRLRPGAYPLKIRAAGQSQNRPYQAEESLTVTLVPRPLPHRMPVVMWGSGDFETLQAIGFTHQLVSLADESLVWDAGQPTVAASPERVADIARHLDEHLVRGMGAVAILDPGRWVVRDGAQKEKYQRVNREGKPYEDANVCGLFPEVQAFAYNVGASVAQTFGHFPALEAALIDTEIRDHTNLCFHEHDRAAYRTATGSDFPAEAVSPSGIHYSRIAGFPADRVVPDNDPLLNYYRWFWKDGDGWNALHSQLHRGLKSTGRHDLWTFFDPAVRVPDVWGSGGEVDVISHWTYSYPDPIKIGQATDELFAMADGAARGQRVMKMTQIIWYRSQTAPELPADETKRVAWEKEIPDAKFITIAPDHLREAFWSKISRPVQGIMYHGWGSLVPAEHGSYRHTNPATRETLTELVRDVVQPLGPTLLRVPDRASDVAILESFAAQVLAGRGTRGWSHQWEADLHLVSQWAHLQPTVVFDETVLRDGLDGFRLLLLPNCDVLTAGVAARIAEFQQRGGLVVADENLAPAIKPDVLLTSYRRTGAADADKAALQARAAELRQAIDAKYERYGDAESPDTVLRFRHYDSTDYLFVLNDNRTFGGYVGHHGKVMEQGLPHADELRVRRPGGFVYDLVRHEPVVSLTKDGWLKFAVALGPGDGRVFMIAERPLAAVEIAAPARAQLGAGLRVEIRVVDETGEPLPAVIPLHVEILDPQGRAAEFSGFYGARDGRQSIDLDLAPNDLPGNWTLRARELASGRTHEQLLVVEDSRAHRDAVDEGDEHSPTAGRR